MDFWILLGFFPGGKNTNSICVLGAWTKYSAKTFADSNKMNTKIITLMNVM